MFGLHICRFEPQSPEASNKVVLAGLLTYSRSPNAFPLLLKSKRAVAQVLFGTLNRVYSSGSVQDFHLIPSSPTYSKQTVSSRHQNINAAKLNVFFDLPKLSS